ncbi:Uncharacterised protein [Mycobacteroides abscessus subsp. abscessus]|nr:Uncharacterised protein [Mycobacteroides abscessus subsp. abscessus]
MRSKNTTNESAVVPIPMIRPAIPARSRVYEIYLPSSTRIANTMAPEATRDSAVSRPSTR